MPITTTKTTSVYRAQSPKSTRRPQGKLVDLKPSLEDLTNVNKANFLNILQENSYTKIFAYLYNYKFDSDIIRLALARCAQRGFLISLDHIIDAVSDKIKSEMLFYAACSLLKDSKMNTQKKEFLYKVIPLLGKQEKILLLGSAVKTGDPILIKQLASGFKGEKDHLYDPCFNEALSLALEVEDIPILTALLQCYPFPKGRIDDCLMKTTNVQIGEILGPYASPKGCSNAAEQATQNRDFNYAEMIRNVKLAESSESERRTPILRKREETISKRKEETKEPLKLRMNTIAQSRFSTSRHNSPNGSSAGSASPLRTASKSRSAPSSPMAGRKTLRHKQLLERQEKTVFFSILQANYGEQLSHYFDNYIIDWDTSRLAIGHCAQSGYSGSLKVFLEHHELSIRSEAWFYAASLMMDGGEAMQALLPKIVKRLGKQEKALLISVAAEKNNVVIVEMISQAFRDTKDRTYDPCFCDALAAALEQKNYEILSNLLASYPFSSDQIDLLLPSVQDVKIARLMAPHASQHLRTNLAAKRQDADVALSEAIRYSKTESSPEEIITEEVSISTQVDADHDPEVDADDGPTPTSSEI
ncbi:MAG: hypothetical protein WCF19_00920 [Chlamydiales bacterium]